VEVPRGDSLHWCHSRGYPKESSVCKGGILKKNLQGVSQNRLTLQGVSTIFFFLTKGYQLFNPLKNVLYVFKFKFRKDLCGTSKFVVGNMSPKLLEFWVKSNSNSQIWFIRSNMSLLIIIIYVFFNVRLLNIVLSFSILNIEHLEHYDLNGPIPMT
jgi:hypothetical protein